MLKVYSALRICCDVVVLHIYRGGHEVDEHLCQQQTIVATLKPELKPLDSHEASLPAYNPYQNQIDAGNRAVATKRPMIGLTSPEPELSQRENRY